MLITWLSEICLVSLIVLFWNSPLLWNFPLMICNFLLLFSNSKNFNFDFTNVNFNYNNYYLLIIKVSEYPFKQNKNVLKNMTVLLNTYFYNISLNVLRPTFFNICNLPFLRSPNIGKIKVKVGPKTNYFLALYELLHQQN